MKIIDDYLARIAADPVHYALRIIVWAAILGLVLMVLWPREARAETVAIAEVDGVTLILTNDECEIPAFKERFVAKVKRIERDVITFGCYMIHEKKNVVAVFLPKTLIMWSGGNFTLMRGM